MENKKTKLQEIRDAVVDGIHDLVVKHKHDVFDVMDLGGTPVIWPSSDDQDFDTYTLDRVRIDKEDVLVDSSSSDNSRTDRVEDLSTDIIVDLLEFLEEYEEHIWQPDESAAEEFIMETYHKEDACMGDLLGNVYVDDLPYGRDMTVEQVFELYIRCKHKADGDDFFRENDGCGDKGDRLNLLTEEVEPLKKPVFVLYQVANNDGVNDSCVINIYSDRAEAEADLKLYRDRFVNGLDDDENLESLDLLVDTLTDKPNFFCYYNFERNHHFQLEIVEKEI